MFVAYFSKAQLDPEYLLVLKKATTAEMNAAIPDKGAMVYNIDNDQVYQYDGTSWVNASADGDTNPANELQALSYDVNTHIVTLTNGGTIDLSGLMDDEDWTIAGNHQYSAVTGNVGVGNPSPVVKLDVTGDIHSTQTISIGPNATGSRLSIYDDGHSGSMFDIQTDDQGPWGLRLLNQSYSADLAKSFRMYQSNTGRMNMSVGDLSSSFLTIDPEYSNGHGSIGFGTGASDQTFLYLNRGTVDVGDAHYYNQTNRMVRKGAISTPATTIGLDNILGANTTGDSATYIGNRNVTYIGNGAYDFRSLTGSYDFVYNQSTANNSDKAMYGYRSYAYDYGASGVSAIYGGVFNARKQDGAGAVRSIIGLSATASKANSTIGNVTYAYGLSINAFGGSNSVRGSNMSVHTANAAAESLYGSNIRIYADSAFQAKNAYGVNINTGKYKEEIVNNIYNINVSSTGYSTLTNNYGSRFYLRDGVNNYGVYLDVANGSGNNYAIYANKGQSFFRDKVGIGTAAPDEALHIAGNMRLNGAFEDKDGQAGSVGQILSSSSTGTDWIDVTSINNWTVSGNDLYPSVSGSIGIGTTTPDQKLDVNGAAVIGSNNIDNSLDGQGHFQANSPLNNAGFVATPWVYARAIEGGQRGSASTLITLGGENGFTGSDQIGLVTNGLQRMIIDADGEIGVNTTTPRGQMDIDGVLVEGKSKSMFGNAPNAGSCTISHGIASYFSSASDNNYIHIKLPYTTTVNNNMYHIKATGYRYGGAANSRLIDITWVGYCYAAGSSLLNTQVINNGGSDFSVTQYVGSDNSIYLRFRAGSGNNYYQSFRIDSMRVGNGTVLKEGDVEIINSASATL